MLTKQGNLTGDKLSYFQNIGINVGSIKLYGGIVRMVQTYNRLIYIKIQTCRHGRSERLEHIPLFWKYSVGLMNHVKVHTPISY